MTDYEWRAAELMLKLAIATEALQQKHEENLELIQERNKWQAIAEDALQAAAPAAEPLWERSILTAKEIEELYEDEVNAQVVCGLVKQSSTDENAQPGARNGCRESPSPDADQLSFLQLSFVQRNYSERRVSKQAHLCKPFRHALGQSPSTGGAHARPRGVADLRRHGVHTRAALCAQHDAAPRQTRKAVLN